MFGRTDSDSTKGKSEEPVSNFVLTGSSLLLSSKYASLDNRAHARFDVVTVELRSWKT